MDITSETLEHVSFDVHVYEDVGAELDEFVLLNHAGDYQAAQRLYQECLAKHSAWFPIAAEYADCLLRQGDFIALQTFCGYEVNRLQDLEEHRVMSLMLAVAELEITPETSFPRSVEQAYGAWSSLIYGTHDGKPSDAMIHCMELFLHVTTRALQVFESKSKRITQAADRRQSMALFENARDLFENRPGSFGQKLFSYLLDHEYFWEAHRILSYLYLLFPLSFVIKLLDLFLVKAKFQSGKPSDISIAAASKTFFAALESKLSHKSPSATWLPDFICELVNGRLEQVLRLLLSKQDIIERSRDISEARIILSGDEMSLIIDLRAKNSNNETALFYAVSSDNPEILAVLLHEISMYGASILHTAVNSIGNYQSKGGRLRRSLLMLASENASVAVTDLLLSHGAVIEAQDFRGETALILAMSKNNCDIVQLLLDKGANVEAQDTRGRTALFHAVSAGYQGMATKQLLDKGANIETQDTLKQTALSHATPTDYHWTVELLVEKGANMETQDLRGHTALIHATSAGDQWIVKLLLDKGANIETQDLQRQTALIHATSAGDQSIVRLLLDKGANMDIQDLQGRTALIHATSPGHQSIVELLLERSANIEKQDTLGRTALIHAVQLDEAAVRGLTQRPLFRHGSSISARKAYNKLPIPYARIIRLLLSHGAHPNVPDLEGRTALLYAVPTGHQGVVLTLLQARSDVDLQSRTGETPLMRAVSEGDQAITQLLLEAGAQVNLKDETGQTALFRATSRGDQNAIMILAKSGSNVNSQSITGETPLMRAVSEGQHAITQLLLKVGAQVNLKDETGQNALFRAILRGDQHAIMILAEFGLDVNSQSYIGLTPLMHAVLRKKFPVIQSLLDLGADAELEDEAGKTVLMHAASLGSKDSLEILESARLKKARGDDAKSPSGYLM